MKQLHFFTLGFSGINEFIIEINSKGNYENEFRFLKLLCDIRIECMSHMGHFYDSYAFFRSFLEVDSRWSPFHFHFMRKKNSSDTFPLSF